MDLNLTNRKWDVVLVAADVLAQVYQLIGITAQDARVQCMQFVGFTLGYLTMPRVLMAGCFIAQERPCELFVEKASYFCDQK